MAQRPIPTGSAAVVNRGLVGGHGTEMDGLAVRHTCAGGRDEFRGPHSINPPVTASRWQHDAMHSVALPGGFRFSPDVRLASVPVPDRPHPPEGGPHVSRSQNVPSPATTVRGDASCTPRFATHLLGHTRLISCATTVVAGAHRVPPIGQNDGSLRQIRHWSRATAQLRPS